MAADQIKRACQNYWGGGAAPPHAMALISITLFGKRIKNPFSLSQMYSLLSEIPFLFSFSSFLFFYF